MKRKIILELTEEQAEIVAKSCEFFSRVKMGQFGVILWNLMDNKANIDDDFCERRDAAQDALVEARKHIYPELNGIGYSYGIGKFEDADKAFDVYQVLRNQFNDNRKPFSFYELPVCYRKEIEK